MFNVCYLRAFYPAKQELTDSQKRLFIFPHLLLASLYFRHALKALDRVVKVGVPCGIRDYRRDAYCGVRVPCGIKHKRR